MQKKSVGRDEKPRRVVLDSARDCILKFGYGKCSLEDIAKQAAISRPLIYRKFKSKEEIFAAPALKGRGSISNSNWPLRTSERSV
jgi:AcrR family transcriptional regulator